MNNYMNNMPNNFNSIYPNAFSNKNQFIKNNDLAQKLQKQAGDNMNFNKPSFDGNANPNQLYDVYNGFIRGNMFPELYNQYKISKPYEIRPMNKQAELLTKVDAYCFAAHELNLYLDTHPEDREMINLFREYTEDSKLAISEYENKFGPLFVDASTSSPWSWDNSPWPWENN